MVKTRVTSKLANLHKAWFGDMVSGKNFSFGREDITLYSVTITKDSMGDISAISETSSTISGDMQFVTKEDKQLIDFGWAKVGDGKFYVASSVSINENDEILVDSVRWILTRKFEGPEIDGVEVHQAWIATRKEMS